ncbi:unnamed protein product, partial [Iphiclides podalirius]
MGDTIRNNLKCEGAPRRQPVRRPRAKRRRAGPSRRCLGGAVAIGFGVRCRGFDFTADRFIHKMPEQSLKMPQNASPPVRTGAGDISERELSREQYSLNSTPTARVQPAHPKKIQYSVPVNKFTARGHAPGPNLARIKSCLDEYRCKGKATPKVARVAHKAASMEDLTPTKRVLKGRKDPGNALSVVRSPGVRTLAEEQASAKIGRFMLLSAWRRRRQELRCLRKTLEVQVTSSERLRAQVWALKSLLDADNSKVRLAMRELERLKQLLRDKDREKAVLEKEQRALEADVCAAEDRASELSIDADK